MGAGSCRCILASPRQTPSQRTRSTRWSRYGLEPRWRGYDSSDCAAAIGPSVFHDRGADELERFLAGARQRDDTALVVAVLGDANDNGEYWTTSLQRLLTGFDTSVRLNKTLTSVNGRRLPTATRPRIAPDLGRADRDLAIRLLNRPTSAPWWQLQLSGATTIRGDGFGGPTVHEPVGRLHPILVDPLGAPVVAAWTSPSNDQCWYVLPDATSWASVLGWLIHRALPEYVPAALRRARSPYFSDPALQTSDELAAQQALAELESNYTQEKQRLEAALAHAKTAAEPIRYGLLYGTDEELVIAVSAVLTAAGLSTLDLDNEIGGTKSADLLVSDGDHRVLVEVKSASGAAQESFIDQLQRHLATWPHLRPNKPVDGRGALVVNHQHRLHPGERTAEVYSRPEFVNALGLPVICLLSDASVGTPLALTTRFRPIRCER